MIQSVQRRMCSGGNGSSSVDRARQALNAYPRLLVECSAEASAYAKCVGIRQDNIAKDVCAAEFAALKKCFVNASKRKA